MKQKYYSFSESVLLEGFMDGESNVGALWIRPLFVREVYMFMMEHLNEDFDDDLLSDVMILLGCI